MENKIVAAITPRKSIKQEKPCTRLRCIGNSPGDETYSAVIRVYDAAGNVIETHEHKGDFKEWVWE
jgi:hypothetical protein